MFYSMARRSGKIQDWATASKAHHNHQLGHGLRFRSLAAALGLGASHERHPLADLALLRATWRRDQCPPHLGLLPRSNNFRPCLLGFSLRHDARCEYQAKDSPDACECQALVEMPSWSGKSKGAVSLRDAHPSRPEVVGTTAGRRGVSFYELGFPTPADPDM